MSSSDRSTHGPIASELTGVWTLVSYAKQQEGRADTFPFGPRPEGFLIYTPDGFVSAQLMKPGRSLFQTTDWNGGTAEEYQDSGSGYIAYCGVFEVDEDKKAVIHIPSVALIPNLIRQREVRSLTLVDDKLTLRANTGLVTTVLDWRKVGNTTNFE